MKWLATFLCLLAMPAFAEENTPEKPSNMVQLPLFMTCAPGSPEKTLRETYDELPFVEGIAQIIIGENKGINGNFYMYLNPKDDHSFSIVLQPQPGIFCLVMSGKNIKPSMTGDKL